MTLDELTHKVENDGATSEGRLTAEEYNTLLDAVKENRDNSTTAHIEGIVQGYTASEVTVGVANPVSSDAVAEALADAVQITPQTFSEAQKQTARDNIDAMTLYDLPDEVLSSLWYGVEWNVTVSATAMARIGNLSLHRSLPIQNMMRGCLLNDNGDVVEYLPETSWVGATLDGSRGQVMVELPEHYRKFETDGNIRRCKMSLYPLRGYHRVPKMYISAYEATLQRSTTTLASVMSEDADYRGGNNTATWDGTYRSLLGRPATNITRTGFRNYARKRKSSTTEWNCQDYNAYKAVFWLYVAEYANRNCQLAFNAEKDANGFAQGGLGDGVTTMKNADWGSYFAYFPFVPCGRTNELGNASGEVAYNVTLDDGTILTTVYANRYRGIENPFGHIWKWMDGIDIQIEPDGTGDSSSKVYVADDTANYNDSNYDGYTMRGLGARANGYVRELVFGEFGDIIPAEVGGGSTTYWADSLFTNIPETEARRCVVLGGSAANRADAGFACVRSTYAPSFVNVGLGSRLCFIPNEN